MPQIDGGRNDMEAAMMTHKTGAVIATLLAAALAASASAQSTGQEPAAPVPQTTQSGAGHMPMGQGMMGQGMGMGMMSAMMAAPHVEGRIAFLKTELKITDAQQKLWNAVADEMRADAQTMMAMQPAMMTTGTAASLPDRLATREKLLSARLDALRKYQKTVDALYVALSDGQKKTADELLMPGMMGSAMTGMGMMGRMGAR